MSNFPPIAQQAYICLQCRSRLAVISTRAHRILKTRAKKPPRRDFSTRPTSLQLVASVEENESRHPRFFETAPDSGESISQEHDDIKLPNDCNAARMPYTFKRAHLYSKDELGVTTLGKPAEVLRLRDLPNRHKASKWWLAPDPHEKRPASTEPLTASDILQRVMSERGLVSTARVGQNIEQLKQDWLSTLDSHELGPTASECSELGKQLYDGFTTKQLSAYLRQVRIPRYRYRALLDLSGPFVSTSFTRSEWTLGTTPFPGEASQRLQSMAKDGKEQDITPNHSASTLLAESRRSGDPFKHVQVNEIMQKCWNITPREELDSIGEVDIMIPEAHLELLASHKRNILQQLGAEYEAKIDFSKAEHIIRLTANQAVCTSSVKLLLMVLDEIVCHKMNVKEEGNSDCKAKDYHSLPNDDALREIERLSSTVIRRPRSNKHAAILEQQKFLIYSLKNDTESLDDAQKFVRQLCRPSRRTAPGAFYGGRFLAAKKPNLVPVVRTVGLPMTERRTGWSRISTASSKYGARARDDFYVSEALKGVGQHLESLNATSKAIRRPPSHPHWHTSLSRNSSVVLGQVLYPAKTMTPVKREKYFLDALEKYHLFDTDVPGLRKALDLNSARTYKVEELRVQFKATDASMGGILSSQLPDLEIRFSIDDSSHSVVPQSVYLILGGRQADLLLPHGSTDMRFAAQIYRKATSNLDPQILDFILRSNLCVFGAQKHEVPDGMTIQLPQRLLPWALNPESEDEEMSKDAENSKSAEISEDAGESRDAEESEDAEGSKDAGVLVNYSLAGIEHHHILRGKSGQGHHLRALDVSFSIIDSGPIGGQRQEVRIFEEEKIESAPDPLPLEKDDDQELEKSTVKRLYDCAHNLIQNLGGPNPNLSDVRSSRTLRFRGKDRNESKFLSDVPMETYEEGGFSVPKAPHRIRKLIAIDDPFFCPAKPRNVPSVSAHGAASKEEE